jgi:hypothetical protein
VINYEDIKSRKYKNAYFLDKKKALSTECDDFLDQKLLNFLDHKLLNFINYANKCSFCLAQVCNLIATTHQTFACGQKKSRIFFVDNFLT